MTGDRPPRPENARRLRDQTWNMITKCWSKQIEHRWDIRSVCNHLWASSIQGGTEDEREAQTKEPILNGVEDPPPRKDVPGERLPIFPEELGLSDSDPSPAKPTASNKSAGLPKKHFTFSTRGTSYPEEPIKVDPRKSRKSAFWGLKQRLAS